MGSTQPGKCVLVTQAAAANHRRSGRAVSQLVAVDVITGCSKDSVGKVCMQCMYGVQSRIYER